MHENRLLNFEVICSLVESGIIWTCNLSKNNTSTPRHDRRILCSESLVRALTNPVCMTVKLARVVHRFNCAKLYQTMTPSVELYLKCIYIYIKHTTTNENLSKSCFLLTQLVFLSLDLINGGQSLREYFISHLSWMYYVLCMLQRWCMIIKYYNVYNNAVKMMKHIKNVLHSLKAWHNITINFDVHFICINIGYVHTQSHTANPIALTPPDGGISSD